MIASSNKDNKNQGFTLVEMAVVFLVAGILVVVGIQAVRPLMMKVDMDETKVNMAKVSKALAHYARRNNRLPCPSDPDDTPPGANPPFGAERGSGTNGDGIGSCTGANVEGIVPFLTLGLTEEVIRDGWGNFMTYRVSPTFTFDPTDVTRRAHKRCWTENVWFTSGLSALTYGTPGANLNIGGVGVTVNLLAVLPPPTSSSVGAVNRDLPKARFCCPDKSPATAAPGTDISIVDAAGDSVWTLTRDTDPGNVRYFLAGDDPIDATTIAANGEHTTVPAYVLVSHGRDGEGDFLPDGTRPRNVAVMGNGEEENTDGDRVFVQTQRSDAAGNNHYDDIVVFQTQDGLMAAAGGGSCARP